MKTLFKLLLPVIFAMTLLEGLSRLVFPMPEVLNFNRVNYSNIFTTAEDRNRSTLANASFTWFSDLDGAGSRHDLNLYGFRDRNWRRQTQPDVIRVAFVGDSMLESFMASMDETVTDGFESVSAPNIETLNFGIGAAGIPVSINVARDLVQVFRPQYLIVIISENSIRPTAYNPGWLANPLIPEVSRAWMPRLLQVFQYRKRHGQVIWRWNDRPFQFMPAVPHPLNPWSNNEKSENFKKFISPEIAQAMQAGKFNPFMAEQLTALEKSFARYVNFRPHFKALNRYLADQSVRMGIVYIPNQVQVSDYYVKFQQVLSTTTTDSYMDEKYHIHARTLTRLCKELGIPFLDLTPDLQRSEKTGQRLYWEYDSHMRAEGYMLAGRTIHGWWVENF